MSKIKLLILLQISAFIFSCSTENISKKEYVFSVASVTGEYDGLVLSNLIKTYLRSYNSLDHNSKLEIQTSVDHSSSVYITNIDNTSDREEVETSLSIKIYNKKDDCYVYEATKNISQFYIFASNDKFISNQKALEKIKFDNTEELIKKFINKIFYLELECNLFLFEEIKNLRRKFY
jgi:hypothetical protein